MSTRVLLTNNQSPGDVLMLTAAVKDLRTEYPNIRVNVETTCPQLWEGNPYLDLSLNRSNSQIVNAEYRLIHKSAQLPYHFIHGFRKDLERKLNLIIPPTTNVPSVFLNNSEIEAPSRIEELGHVGPYWIINAGGKKDYTAKWWNPDYAQELVDHYAGKMLFVQIGGRGKDHYHPELRGVVNLVGKTDLRQLMHLVWRSSGIICPVTMLMHLSAALPDRKGGIRPCIVTAGGREPASWEAYNGHHYISKVGAIPCAANGGCWKSKGTRLQCQQEIKQEKKLDSYCENVIKLDREIDGEPFLIPKCLQDTKPAHIISIIDEMIENKRIEYGKQTSEFRKSHLSRG